MYSSTQQLVLRTFLLPQVFFNNREYPACFALKALGPNLHNEWPNICLKVILILPVGRVGEGGDILTLQNVRFHAGWGCPVNF